MCDCWSYNGAIGTTPNVVVDPNDYIDVCATRTVCLDACIADAVKALWRGGVWTGGSCCGHNGHFGDSGPSVVLKDHQDAFKAKAILDEVDSRQWRILQWRLIDVTDGYPETDLYRDQS